MSSGPFLLPTRPGKSRIQLGAMDWSFRPTLLFLHINMGAAIAVTLYPHHQGRWLIRTFSLQVTKSPLLLLFSHSVVSNSLQPYGLWPFQAPPVHRIPQGRILEWVAISLSRGSSQPRVQTCISCIAGGFFYHWA